MALSRLVLAAKTAVAAAVAWYLAPFVPFADADYSYYAPMGVLVSMYPTVADSARAGLQALVGLAIGIVLGFGGLAVVGAGAPGVVAIAIVVGVGVALGGIRRLGVGRDWIALAGLFVLVLGGSNADAFSTSYLVTMAFGVAVGITANYLLVPPLYLREAGAQLATLRERIADTLDQMAAGVDAGVLKDDDLVAAAENLAALAEVAAEGVQQASRSGRGNPRGRRRAAEQAQLERGWRALQRSVLLARELADILIQHPEVYGQPRSDDGVLSAALRAVGTAISTVATGENAAAHLAVATDAIDRYVRVGADPDAPQPSPAVTVSVCLGRLVQLARSLL
ncbi:MULTISPECIES: FUSC family protein [unclassified Microbacterium]|uniref:FUSC family protein n=1 Tax=unclassified Microbacterium TaxID=2609290 RepID=UPI00214BB617|nr:MULTISPECIES: FUSC family protein [unclassified Microbacterium]MCR2785058.1 FUSC family protein [Microbacterium sp. zg.B96]MDL5352427.1 FUSC family protein [Microbacterium sp. zg-YB36]WIM16593.1 FUSC family protein [Microbacterium sp. zg-B96]